MIGGSYYELDRPVVNGPHEGEIACVAVSSAGDSVIDLQTLFSRCWAQDYLTVTLDATPGTVFLGGLNSTGAALSIVAAFPARKPQRILSKGRRYLIGRMASGSGVLRIWASSLAPLTVPVVASPFVDFVGSFSAQGGFNGAIDKRQQVDFVGSFTGAGGFNAVVDKLQQVDFSGSFTGAGGFTGQLTDASGGFVDFSGTMSGAGGFTAAFDVLQQKDFSANLSASGGFTGVFEVLQQVDFVGSFTGSGGMTGALDDAAGGGVTMTVLTSGVGTTTNPSTTSISVTSGKFYYICAITGNGGNPANGRPSAISGAGMTFAQVGAQGAGSEVTAWVWKAQAGSTTSGALAITTTYSANGWIVFESDSDVVAGSVVSGTGSPPSVALNSYASTNNRGVAVCGSTWHTLDAHVPVAGWTQDDRIEGVNISGWSHSEVSIEHRDTDNSVSASFTGGGGDTKVLVAFELAG